MYFSIDTWKKISDLYKEYNSINTTDPFKKEQEQRIKEFKDIVKGEIIIETESIIQFKLSQGFLFTVRKDNLDTALKTYKMFKKLSKKKLILLDYLAIEHKDIGLKYNLIKYISTLNSNQAQKLVNIFNKYNLLLKISSIPIIGDCLLFNLDFGSNVIKYIVSTKTFDDDILLLNTFAESINNILIIKELRNK